MTEICKIESFKKIKKVDKEEALNKILADDWVLEGLDDYEKDWYFTKVIDSDEVEDDEVEEEEKPFVEGEDGVGGKTWAELEEMRVNAGKTLA